MIVEFTYGEYAQLQRFAGSPVALTWSAETAAPVDVSGNRWEFVARCGRRWEFDGTVTRRWVFEEN